MASSIHYGEPRTVEEFQHLWQFVSASEDQAAMGQYSALVAKYQAFDGMTPGEQLDYSEDDDWSRTGSNAVQSTH